MYSDMATRFSGQHCNILSFFVKSFSFQIIQPGCKENTTKFTVLRAFKSRVTCRILVDVSVIINYPNFDISVNKRMSELRCKITEL